MANVFSSQDTRLSAGARVILPAIWLGLIIGISLIEAPLKFTAPGITIPLGLGIGRLVFTAMNWVEIGIAVILLWSVLKDHVGRLYRWLACGMIAVLIIKVTVIRPPAQQPHGCCPRRCRRRRVELAPVLHRRRRDPHPRPRHHAHRGGSPLGVGPACRRQPALIGRQRFSSKQPAGRGARR
ncbi:hypothetical protein [Brevibacterium aurantiacum]|uniref:hypothetical protein n=1 Tax=Brevibacterium aurantiacum TaxID=273384 RepID=UPI0030B9BA36